MMSVVQLTRLVGSLFGFVIDAIFRVRLGVLPSGGGLVLVVRHEDQAKAVTFADRLSRIKSLKYDYIVVAGPGTELEVIQSKLGKL